MNTRTETGILGCLNLGGTAGIVQRAVYQIIHVADIAFGLVDLVEVGVEIELCLGIIIKQRC